MALLWIEGFEGFGTTTGVAPSPTGVVGRKYTIQDESVMQIEAGRTAGRCIEIRNLDDWIRSSNLTTNATMVIGFAFKLSSLPGDSRGNILLLYDNETLGVYVRVKNTTGQMEIWADSTLLETSTQVIIPGVWYYLEMKILCHATAGTYEVRINGTAWMSGTGADTKTGSNDYHTAFRIDCPYNSTIYFDDLYVLDGTAGLNDFLGSQRVVAINPDGDDTVTWDRSAEATNREVVDDGLLLDNTDYVYTSTLPEQDLYDYESVPATVAVVNGIQIMTETNMEEGSCDLAAVVKSNVTESVGTANTVVVGSDVTHIRVVEYDPDASAPWTETTLNAAKFGVKATV